MEGDVSEHHLTDATVLGEAPGAVASWHVTADTVSRASAPAVRAILGGH